MAKRKSKVKPPEAQEAVVKFRESLCDLIMQMQTAEARQIVVENVGKLCDLLDTTTSEMKKHHEHVELLLPEVRKLKQENEQLSEEISDLQSEIERYESLYQFLDEHNAVPHGFGDDLPETLWRMPASV